MLHLLLILGCSGAPQTMRSEPAAPTVELGGDKPQSEITWSTLKGLLPEGEPAIPTTLGVSLDQDEAEARKAFEAARHTKLTHPPDQVVDDVTVMSGRLQAFPDVGVSLLFREGRVVGVDLSLPRDEALFAANQTWGAPDDKDVGGEGVPRPVWVHAGLRAVLLDLDDNPKIAILKFSKVE